jgi:hypothetical protein
LVKFGIMLSDMVTFLSHLDSIKNTQIFYLIETHPINKQKWFFLLIWLNTSNEVQICIR